MRRAALVLILATVLALPGARATGFDFPSGRSFAQTAAEGGVNSFTIPFHTNVDGFVYLKMLDTPSNAVNNGGASPNGSASAKTGWWIEWAITQAGAAKELGARDDGTPTDLVPVKTGEDDSITIRVHFPAAANAAGAADLVYGALAFRLDTGGQGPGTSSGAQMDEARSFHVEIDMTGGAVPVVPTPDVPTPDGGSTTTPGTTGSNGAVGATPAPTSAAGSDAQSPTPPVSGINVGGPRSESGNGPTVQLVTQEASLPGWVIPLLLGEGVLVALVAVVAIVVALRPQRIEIVLRTDTAGFPIAVAHPSVVSIEESPAHSITVQEK